MIGRRRKGLAVGIALLALVVGAGAALAGGLGFGDDNKAFLNDVAKRLDVTPEKLQEALLGAYDARLDAAVAAGTITKEQADELKQRAKDNGGLPLFGPGRGGFEHTTASSAASASTQPRPTSVSARPSSAPSSNPERRWRRSPPPTARRLPG